MISTDAATNLNPAVLNHWKTEEDLTFTVLGRGRAHFTSPAERAILRCTHLANLVNENLLGMVVRTKQVTPEMYFVFAYAYAAFVIIGQSASPSLLRTKGITISPYKYLTQRTTSPHRIIPYVTTVRYPSSDSSKETPAWNEAIALGPAQSRMLPGLASSAAVHDREIYLQDIYSGNFLIQGTLLVDMIEHRPKLTARLAHHARETSPQAVLAQQNDILTDLARDSAVNPAAPSDVPTMSSTSSATPTPAPDTPDSPTPISVPNPPRPRRSPRYQDASPSTSDPDLDPTSVDRPSSTSPPPTSPASPTSRRHAQAARPCYHRPPQPGDDIIVRWYYDDGFRPESAATNPASSPSRTSTATSSQGLRPSSSRTSLRHPPNGSPRNSPSRLTAPPGLTPFDLTRLQCANASTTTRFPNLSSNLPPPLRTTRSIATGLPVKPRDPQVITGNYR